MFTTFTPPTISTSLLALFKRSREPIFGSKTCRLTGGLAMAAKYNQSIHHIADCIRNDSLCRRVTIGPWTTPSPW